MRFTRPLALAATIVLATALVASAAVPPTAFHLSVAASSGESQPRGVLVADVTGDGKADVVSVIPSRASGANAAIYIFAQGANGVSATPTRTLTGSVYEGHPELSVGDVNGDGHTDLAVAWVQAYDVDGNPLSTIDLFRANLNGVLPLTPSQTIAIAPDVHDAALADMTGDGRDDLVYSKGTASPYAFALRAQTSSGTLTAATSLGPDDGGMVAIGDINNDGLNDWLGGGWHPSDITVHIQQPDHSFAIQPVSLGTETVNDSWLMDVNDDGRDDVVAIAYVAATLTYVRRLSGGGFSALTTLPIEIDVTNPWPSSWAVGDYNDDGRDDLALFGWGVFQMRVFLQQDTGGFGTGCSYPAEQQGFDGIVSSGDLNGDGRDDIAMGDNENAQGRVWINRQLAPPLDLNSALTLHGPDAAQSLTTLTFDGELSSAAGGCFSNDQISITRTDEANVTTQLSPTSLGMRTMNGVGFSFQDTPPAAGTYRYQASWAGDDSHVAATSAEWSVIVSKRASSLAFSVSDRHITYGKHVTLHADLAGSDAAADVMFFGEVNGSTVALGTVPVDDHGAAELTVAPAYIASYWASYAGSDNYLPSTSTKTKVVVDAVTTAKLVRYKRMDGSTAVYACCKMHVRYAVAPNQAGLSVTLKVWVWSNSAWHNLGSLTGGLGSDSTGGGPVTVKNGTGYRFRMQVCFPGSDTNGASCAPYLYFRFV
jgi:hypothetical protein